MKTTMIRAVAALSLAAAALMAPTAANAYTDPAPVSVSPSTATPGGTVIFTTTQAPFQGSEQIAISINGANANSVTLGSVAAQTNNSLSTAADNGKLNVKIKLPSNASGTYYLTFTGQTSKTVLHASLVVSPANSASNPAKGGLAVTGFDAGRTTGLWVAGGALVAAGGAVAIGTIVRRRRRVNV
ncbi:hypothetical protein [Microbacterium trichothecenolyticum]|uniref:Peptidase n=1 Tax=Microbacterium trichothecenolyticum TaxID=69370 RepID=A0ABU0TUG1_MICTR|nr:hypothetical protein [Microbacterium trichothecenolyticum]MDQ1123301.1 hypothetical protein [Microbacterium trichothecenolyticum]